MKSLLSPMKHANVFSCSKTFTPWGGRRADSGGRATELLGIDDGKENLSNRKKAYLRPHDSLLLLLLTLLTL